MVGTPFGALCVAAIRATRDLQTNACVERRQTSVTRRASQASEARLRPSA